MEFLTHELPHEVVIEFLDALALARSLVTGGIESSVFRVKDIVDDGECVEQLSRETGLVVGMCYRLDCVGGVAAEPRPNPPVAPEVLLEEGLGVLNVAAKRLGN